MTKRAAVINDLSSFGRCSLTASVAVLSVMGITPCPLPTAVLSAQSEFDRYCSKDLTDEMPRYTQAWRENGERFDAICTGYFASAAQIEHALEFIRCFRREDCAVIVDPVLGDDGKLYPATDKAMCADMKRLASQADILIPNLTELCFLADADFEVLRNDLSQIKAAATRAADGRGMIVTGIHDGETLCNLVLCDGETHWVRRPSVGGRFSGTGDLFSAVVCGCVLRGKSLKDAAVIAADFVADSIKNTVKEKYDPLYGVDFEQNLYYLAEVK